MVAGFLRFAYLVSLRPSCLNPPTQESQASKERKASSLHLQHSFNDQLHSLTIKNKEVLPQISYLSTKKYLFLRNKICAVWILRMEILHL